MSQFTKLKQVQKNNIEFYKLELKRIKLGLETNKNIMDWKIATINLIEKMKKDFPENPKIIDTYKIDAFWLSMEAQAILNFSICIY